MKNVFENICKQCKNYDTKNQSCTFSVECLALKKLSESHLFQYLFKQLQNESNENSVNR